MKKKERLTMVSALPLGVSCPTAATTWAPSPSTAPKRPPDVGMRCLRGHSVVLLWNVASATRPSWPQGEPPSPWPGFLTRPRGRKGPASVKAEAALCFHRVFRAALACRSLGRVHQRHLPLHSRSSAGGLRIWGPGRGCLRPHQC